VGREDAVDSSSAALHRSSTHGTWSAELGQLVLFELAFYLAYAYGMTFPQSTPAPFWFPNSVLLTALLLTPRRAWWLYLLAPLPIRLLLFVPPGVSHWPLIACYSTDSLSTLLAAALLAPVRDSRDLFGSMPAFARYLGAAVLLTPCASAFAGASILSRETGYWTTWQIWCLGNALAHLTLTPALYCLARDVARVRRVSRPRQIEMLLLTAGAASTCYVTFCPAQSADGDAPVFLYLPLPFAIWAATRFGPPTTAVTLSAVCVVAVTGALHCGDSGPFSSSAGAARTLEIQEFLFLLSISMLSLSVLFRDREVARRRMQQLGLQLVSAQEAERFRIGQELHDDLAQRIVALSWGLAGLARHLEGKEALGAECARLRQQATDICNDVVRLAHELRPVALERRGLVAALEALCDESRHTGSTDVRFEHSGIAQEIGPSVELSLYRVAQEALRNALTHSGSDRILVQLIETDASVTLAIVDHGRGFDRASAERTGLGLSGMADRIQNVGGTLRVDSSPAVGTTVHASVPVAAVGTDRADAYVVAGRTSALRRAVEAGE
jgi:signal transduction histidine kinase